MNKKGQIGFGGIIVLFVGIVFALALLTPIFDTQSQMTTKQSVANQSISTVNAYVDLDDVNESINFSIYTQSEWKVQKCALTSVVMRNGAGTALVDDTDYTLDESNGRFSLLNTSLTIPSVALNLTYTDYNYCADGYNTDSGARGIAGIIGLFAAFMLLAFVLDKSGVLNLGFSR